MALHQTSGPMRVLGVFDAAAAAQKRAMKMAGRPGPGKTGRGGGPRPNKQKGTLERAFRSKGFGPGAVTNTGTIFGARSGAR